MPFLLPFVPALIGAGAGLIGSAISSHATNQASTAATQAADQNNALQRDIYAKNTANLSPFMTRGNAAGDTLNAFLGLGGDSGAAKGAFQNYLDSTGYNFDRNQGISAITGQRATSGLLKSGGTLKALDKFGSDYALSRGINPFLAALQTQQNVGLSGANALAGVGTNFANATSANNDSAATNAGNAAIAGANSTNNVLGQALGFINQANGQSSYGGSGTTSSFVSTPKSTDNVFKLAA